MESHPVSNIGSLDYPISIKYIIYITEVIQNNLNKYFIKQKSDTNSKPQNSIEYICKLGCNVTHIQLIKFYNRPKLHPNELNSINI